MFFRRLYDLKSNISHQRKFIISSFACLSTIIASVAPAMAAPTSHNDGMVDRVHIVIGGNYMGELAQDKREMLITEPDFPGSGLTEIFMFINPKNKPGHYGNWLMGSYKINIHDVAGNPAKLDITISPVSDKTGKFGSGPVSQPSHFQLSSGNSKNKNFFIDDKPVGDVFIEFARVPNSRF